MLAILGDGFVDEARQRHAGLDRLVVDERELRHRVHRQPLRELGTQETGRPGERGRRLAGMRAAGERGK
jgi:hypothetical protein